MSDPIPVVKGTLDLLMLKALLGGEKHGFEIAGWIAEHSGGEVVFDDSAIYHALYRMEERGLVEASWGTTSNNRRARYYAVTHVGRAHLEAESAKVLRFARTLTTILGVEGSAP